MLGEESIAAGADALVEGDYSSAFGSASSAIGAGAGAFGSGAFALGDGATATGFNALADHGDASAYGAGSQATAAGATAVGSGSIATGGASVALGSQAQATGTGTLAFGSQSLASGDASVATGFMSQASGAFSASYGAGTRATGDYSYAAGGMFDLGAVIGFPPGQIVMLTAAHGIGATALGNGAVAGSGYYESIGDTAVGSLTVADGGYSTALGFGAAAGADSSVAIGTNAYVNDDAYDSVALGAGSLADRANTISVGSAGDDYSSAFQRQITNVAAGTEAFDAANLGQLQSVAAVLGGGAGFSGGVFAPPSYLIQGSSYGDIGSAFAAVDQRLSVLAEEIDGIPGNRDRKPGPPRRGSTTTAESEPSSPATGTAGVAGLPAADTPATGIGHGSAGANPVQAGDAGTLASAQGYTDHATAQALQSANGYTDAAAVQTLQSANDYTDTTATQTLHSANAYTDSRFTLLNDDFTALRGEVDSRFNQQEHRIDQMGAMSAAMVNMATSAAGIDTDNRVGIGVGFQNGATALSLGYQRALSERATVTFGGAFSGDDTSVGAGVGFGW